MLKHNFSQEGEVAREIEILIMRIFGLLAFMETISKQLKVTELDKSDASWLGEITENMKYNSASLGAKIWDLVCKWNQDILTVEFWLRNYVKENETRIKYFVEPLKEWAKKLFSLDDVKKIFENSGAVNTDYIMLQNDQKQKETQNSANLKIIHDGLILYNNLKIKLEKKDELCARYKGTIDQQNNEIVNATTRQKELEKKNKDLTDESNDLKKQCNDYMIEVLKIPSLQAIIASEKLKCDVLKKDNVASKTEITRQNQTINDLQGFEKLLKQSTDENELLKNEIHTSQIDIFEKDKKIDDLKIIENNLTVQTVKFDNLQKEMTAMTVECDKLKKENIVSEALIGQQIEQLKKMQLDNSSTHSDESEKSKKIEELESEILVSEKALDVSEKRNESQQTVIHNLRKRARESASAHSDESEKK